MQASAIVTYVKVVRDHSTFSQGCESRQCFVAEGKPPQDAQTAS